MVMTVGGLPATVEQKNLIRQQLQGIGINVNGGYLSTDLPIRLPAIAKLELSGVGTISIEITQRDGTKRIVGPYVVDGPNVDYPFSSDDDTVLVKTKTGTANAEVR